MVTWRPQTAVLHTTIMRTMKIKQLKETYEFACNEYVQKFCNKQEMTNEGWVNGDVGCIALCSDFYFNLHDIVWDVNSKQPKGQIIDWYYENLYTPEKAINYYSYTKRKNCSIPDVSGITTKDGKVCCDQNDDYTIFNTEKSGLCDCKYGHGCKLM